MGGGFEGFGRCIVQRTLAVTAQIFRHQQDSIKIAAPCSILTVRERRAVKVETKRRRKEDDGWTSRGNEIRFPKLDNQQHQLSSFESFPLVSDIYNQKKGSRVKYCFLE
ncbi:hypothetical protein FIBSPDRAFT_265393 [Athelia psychrophila]|uniref:Uncharacterized protein n=1 Tax=Athelia psychrophila TaxID=1759441 RepID=A0A165X7M5_9AGAM|nr:hypothetical protein FIBSPDRAFT_265393 [Fibularhizoctonia sp. CBS 109695]